MPIEGPAACPTGNGRSGSSPKGWRHLNWGEIGGGGGKGEQGLNGGQTGGVNRGKIGAKLGETG